MRSILIVILVALVPSGCGLLNSGDEVRDIRLTLGNGFNQDWVVVEVAGEVVIADTLLSDAFRTPEVCCGPTASATVRLRTGEHVLKIRINERLEQTYTFHSSRWKEIGILYDRERGSVVFFPSRELRIYEG